MLISKIVCFLLIKDIMGVLRAGYHRHNITDMISREGYYGQENNINLTEAD